MGNTFTLHGPLTHAHPGTTQHELSLDDLSSRKTTPIVFLNPTATLNLETKGKKIHIKVSR